MTKNFFNYITYVEEWNPDMVVAMHAFNDMSVSFAHPQWSIGGFNYRWSHYYGAATNAAHAPAFEETLIRFLTERGWFSRYSRVRTDFPVEWFASRDRFRDNLERLARYVEADGAIPVFVTQPFL